MSVIDKARAIISTLPDKPGVYQFVDSYENILYVGKAKNLKKRVASYFAKNQSGKTTLLLKRASDIKHIVVDNESDALLLENNLIKKPGHPARRNARCPTRSRGRAADRRAPCHARACWQE